MDRLTVTLKTVTPMFLGGAEHEATSIRPPSVKGVLRFWWRALNWARFYEMKGRDEAEAEALTALHAEERLLFGSAAEDENGVQAGGQGCFFITVKNPQLNAKTLTPPAEAGIAYLLGQGLYKPGGQARYLRTAFEKNQDIEVAIIFKRNLPSNIPTDYREQIEKAVWLLGLLGGMGSRSRRGLGSLSLRAVKGSHLDLQVPTDTDSYEAVLKNLIGNVTTIPEPPFTAFSGLSRLDVSATGNDPMIILNDVGKEMIFYRSNGRSTTIGDRNILGNHMPILSRIFLPDHDLAKDVASGISRTTHPERVVFGLPHNYLLSSVNGNKVEIQPVHLENGDWTSKGRGRRASALLIHVHQFNNDRYGVIQTFLPAIFLPNGENVEMKQLINTEGNRYIGGINPMVLHGINWTKITDYMDRFKGKTGYKEIL